MRTRGQVRAQAGDERIRKFPGAGRVDAGLSAGGRDALPMRRVPPGSSAMTTIKAIIFDLDGTLADTETLHFEAFAEILRGKAIALSRTEYFTRLIGYNDHDCFGVVLRENGCAAAEQIIADLTARKAAVYQEMIAGRDVLYPGADALVRRCAARFPIALATGTLRQEAETILSRAKLRHLFAAVVAAEDVTHGKPEPDAFVAALLQLRTYTGDDLASGECLVVEDTEAGIEAARRAGMPVIAVAHNASAPSLGRADLVCNSVGEIDLDEVLAIVNGG